VNDFEGRHPISDKPLKVPKSTKDLLQRISEVPDDKISRKLRRDVLDFDLTKVRDHADIARGYQVVIELLLFLGHLDPVRRQGLAIIKALQGYAQHRKEYMEVDFPAQFLEKILEKIAQLEGGLLPLVKKENRTAVKKVFRDIALSLRESNEK
jgi:hypothetical protein